MAFQIFSNAFAEGGWIPELHSCKGADLSPSLEWSGEPDGAGSFALLVEDPDAPSGTFCHWVLLDIPPAVHNLAQGLKPGSVGLSGTNDFGRSGYGGPCPPKGPVHHYYFRLYALDIGTLGLRPGAGRDELLRAIQGHILAETQCMGRFQRH
ncbi:MAG: YbhB/YbcL family Raf kinase inhibitor-like protein [Bryobacteraceae bacterium]|nr:YbhB/YbcL family Raf kinase inhibitor-like protein [Bryobacteraceae bacterium]